MQNGVSVEKDFARVRVFSTTRGKNSVRTQQNASSCDTRFRRNPEIIEIGFQNHPPDRRQFEFEILELKNLKNSNIGARACLPKILTSLCTLLSHKFGIVHISTRFRQATMGFSSSLATKPYKNNLVIISIVFITSLCHF